MDIAPICAACRQKVHTAWRAWSPDGVITCGQPTCVGWAESRGWRLFSAGLIPVRKPIRRGPHLVRPRPEGKPTCPSCGGKLPPPADRFDMTGTAYCSLTCQQRG